MTERNQKDWRELCTGVAKETDSNKFDSLIEQLIKALDDLPQGLDEGEQNRRTSIDLPHEAIQQSAAVPTCDVDRQVARGIVLRLDRMDDFPSRAHTSEQFGTLLSIWQTAHGSTPVPGARNHCFPDAQDGGECLSRKVRH
jgi:hypothetical protein